MELFAYAMRLVNKTWKEMNATIDDINKVSVNYFIMLFEI